MLTGLRRSEKFDYISERDTHKTEEEGATIFELGTLPVDIRTSIQDGVMNWGGNDSFKMNISRQHLEAVRFGLKGVRNFVDEDKKPIELATEKLSYNGREYIVPTMDFLSYFPTWLINELGKKVMGTNAVSETERKNSNTQ